MGKIYLRKILLLSFLGIMLSGLLLCLFPNKAFAQSCVAQIKNPAAASATSVGKYGEPRPGRVHRGVDIMLPMCLVIENQPGCTIIPSGNSPIWKTGGYGLYARYNCGPRVEVRYAHLNGWSPTGRPINGRSGAARPTPPHIHYEVLIDKVKVDPQCVWGAHPNPSDCCIGVGTLCNLGASQADMCDQTTLDNLKKNAFARYSNLQKGLVSSKSVAPGRDPSSFGAGPFEVDLPGCEEKGGDPQKPVEHEHDGFEDLEEGGDLPVVQPPTDPDTPDPPEQPPGPDVPGVGGGTPELVPPPDTPPENMSGCATDTWAAMVNQAVMETRREDILNKRFIVKPDSVLDYSCFDLYAKNTGEKAGPIFSETKRWANLYVNIHEDGIKPPYPKVYIKRELGSQALDSALMDVVVSVATNYRRGQFNNPMLAGSTPVDAAAGATSCDVMAKVWKAAKCKNFDDVAVFYTFDELKKKEPREYPANMKCN